MYLRVLYGKKNAAYNYSEFVADSESDIQLLPTCTNKGTSGNNTYDACSVGSKVYVSSTRKVYIIDNTNTWRLMIDYSVSGGGGGAGAISASDDDNGNVVVV